MDQWPRAWCGVVSRQRAACRRQAIPLVRLFTMSATSPNGPRVSGAVGAAGVVGPGAGHMLGHPRLKTTLALRVGAAELRAIVLADESPPDEPAQWCISRGFGGRELGATKTRPHCDDCFRCETETTGSGASGLGCSFFWPGVQCVYDMNRDPPATHPTRQQGLRNLATGRLPSQNRQLDVESVSLPQQDPFDLH